MELHGTPGISRFQGLLNDFLGVFSPYRLDNLSGMTEKAESAFVLVNILRTSPYSVYLCALGMGLMYPNSGSINLFYALVVNEAVNHSLKLIVKKVFGKNKLTARPEGAKDCGIYPQQFPTLSTSSGMPSGHAQTTTFLASVLLQHRNVFHGYPIFTSPLSFDSGTTFIWVFSSLVLISRTKHGGQYLSPSVGGVVNGCHTVLQVVLGGIIGVFMGWYAFPMIF